MGGQVTVSKFLRRLAVLTICAGLFGVPTADAQYFGRNKVQYRTFSFEILKTEHFDLYFYPEERQAAEIVARMAERWNARLSRFFGHELRGRQSVILYAVAAHFRQTNAVEGLIGEGTGGVTEALKRRIVLPMSGSLADTDHVLGHELVHAFQFDITGDDPRESMATAARHPAVPAVVRRRDGGVPVARSGRRADGDVAARRGDAREAAAHPRPRQPRVLSVPLGPRVLGVHRRQVRRSHGGLADSVRRESRGWTSPAWRGSWAPIPDTLTADWHKAIVQSTAAVAAELPSITSEAQSVIDRDTGGGRYNVGPRLSPDGKLDRLLLGARPVFRRSVHRRRRHGKDPEEALAVGDRPPFRQPRVPEVRGRLESRRRGAS